MFFKGSKKESPPSCNQRDGRVESYFHSFIILYSKLSLIWPGGRGGSARGRKRAAEGLGSLPVLPAASPPGLFLRPSPAPASPAPGPALPAPAPWPEARRQEDEGKASGLGRETLLRRQPRRRPTTGRQAKATSASPPVPPTPSVGEVPL